MRHAYFFFFSILFSTIFFFQSCKNSTSAKRKGIRENQQNINERQIAFITYGTDPDAEKWFEYNDKGDLIIQSISGDTIIYEYSENKIVKRHLDKKLSWQSRVEYTIDKNGRIVSSMSYDENDKEISKNEFLYNDEGYLIKNIEVIQKTGSKYINEYFYEEGNLKEVKAFDVSGKNNSSYAYEYFKDKDNLLNLFMQQISDDIVPNGRFGKKNRNMVKQMSNISKEGDTLSLLNYRYADDVNDSIMKEFQTDVLNEFDTELTYHFSKKN